MRSDDNANGTAYRHHLDNVWSVPRLSENVGATRDCIRCESCLQQGMLCVLNRCYTTTITTAVPAIRVGRAHCNTCGMLND
jgi:hypothetical protein